MKIDIFGNIDLESVQDYYSATIKLQGRDVEIDLNFESNVIDSKILESVSEILENIETQVTKAFDAISNDYDLDTESETARFYLQHHLDEFSKEEIHGIFGNETINKDSFMKSLNLQRIGIYPEDEEEFLIFDIQFPEKITNYLMAVTFNDSNELSCISMDS